MKALPLLLAVSLVANAALLVVVARRPAPATTVAAAGAASHAAPSGASGAPTPKGDLKLPPPLVAALNANDPEALRDLLRAAGLSDEMIRHLVQMQIWKKYEPRYKALRGDEEANKAWWKDNPRNNWNRMSAAQRIEMRKIEREARDEMKRLFGEDPYAQHNRNDPRLAFLPTEKRQALRDIQQDYQDLMNEVHGEANGFRLPSDEEKLRFLREEQERDIQALLTPEERREYELRMSNTAQQLRWRMTQLDATEAEYLAIFPLQKAFDEKYSRQDEFGRQNQNRDQNFWKERQAAEKALNEQIRAIIGEARYADSVRRQDNDYQQLEAATRRLNLPPDTPNRLYDLREPTAAAAQQIADNPALTSAQKKEQLAALAKTTREQVRATLGAEGADAYLKNGGMRWLQEVERGHTITFNKDNGSWNTKALPKDPPKPK